MRGRDWRHWLPVIESLLVFALIMLYIWSLRYTHRSAWFLILNLVLLSHVVHHEKAHSLGFRLTNFRKCVEEFSPAIVFVALALLGAGLVLQTTRPISFEQGLLNFSAYCPWGLFQQYVLNGYFLNRIHSASSERVASILSATLFSGAHLPNVFLMLVTLVAGYLCSRAYLKYRNLYFLGLAHAAIGFLLFLVVPDSISHHLSVGPGWFR